MLGKIDLLFPFKLPATTFIYFYACLYLASVLLICLPLKSLRAQRRVNCIQQCLFTERLDQDGFRADLYRLRPYALVFMCRDENYRDSIVTGHQLTLKLNAAHPRHTYIKYQAVRASKLIRIHELFS
jgi:hypothetical protein